MQAHCDLPPIICQFRPAGDDEQAVGIQAEQSGLLKWAHCMCRLDGILCAILAAHGGS